MGKGEKKEMDGKGGLDQPPPHPLQNRDLSDKKRRCFVQVPMRRFHLPHHRTYGGHFPRPVVASCFLFWSAVAASPERRAWTKCWIQMPASTHSPATGQLFSRGARPATVPVDGAEAYVRKWRTRDRGMELANREGQKVGARLSLIGDVPASTASGATVSTGTVWSTVLVGHRHQMPPNPKPQDHHRANVDSCAALQTIDSFVRNRGRQNQGPWRVRRASKCVTNQWS